MKFSELITHETHVKNLVIQVHQKEINLDILNLASYDVVLNMPWLKEHNPHLNWKLWNIMFNGCKCATINRPTNRQHSVIDKKIFFDLIDTLKTSTWNLSTTTLVDTLGEDGGYKKLRGKKNTSAEDKNSLLLNILKKYHKWLHLFRKDVVTLPQH